LGEGVRNNKLGNYSNGNVEYCICLLVEVGFLLGKVSPL